MPYITKKRQDIDLRTNQRALLISDIFTGQMKSSLKDVIGKKNLIVVNVPENMTKYYQVLDLTVNNYVKVSTRKKV